LICGSQPNILIHVKTKDQILKELENKEVDMSEYSDNELNLEDIPELTDEQLDRMRTLTSLQTTLTQIINATLKHNKVSNAEAVEMMLLDKIEYVTMIRTYDVAWIPEMRLMTLLTMLLRYKKIKLPPGADKQLEEIAKQLAA
jgi:hypothetical protein